MRTMLISLIFFCSLTQFAIASTLSNAKIQGCGEIYTCYVPEICTDVSKPSNTWDSAVVKEIKITDTSQITDDCPAIIRYHLYNPKWVYVSIESLQPIATIKFIEFVHKDNSYPGINFQKLTCKFDDVKKKMIGTIMEPDDHQKTFTKYIENSEGKPNLICEFTVKNKGDNKEIFKASSGGYDRILLNIGTVPSVYPNGVKTKEKDEIPKRSARCDPTNLVNKVEKASRTHKYAKIAYEPGKYYCKDTRYKIQYRKDGSTAEHAMAEQINCNENKFIIGDREFQPTDAIDIRCVAEAKFFCKYTAKPLNSLNSQNALKAPVIGPNMDNSKESVMECPPGKPHLTIAGIREPVLNAKFECVNYGGEPVWTVKQERITKEGPEIYCTEEVECALLKTIPESSVQNGFLGNTDLLPQCFEGGTMHVEEAGKAMMNVTTKCDGKTGEFKYIVESRDFVVGPGTKFVCTYPPVRNEVKNQENAQKILVGSLTAAGVGGLVLLLGTAIGCACVIHRVRKDRKAAARVTNAAWLHYAADEKEKEANKFEGNTKATLKTAVGEPQKWNKMMMSFQSAALNHYMSNGTEKAREMLMKKEGGKPLAKSNANSAAGCELVKFTKKTNQYGWPSMEFDFIHTMKEEFVKGITAGRPKPKKNKSQKTQ